MNDGQIQLGSQLLNGSAAGGDTDSDHAGASHSINDRANLFWRRQLGQGTEIQANGCAIEKMRRRGSFSRQLVENLAWLGGAKPHLEDSHLAETDLNSLLTYGIGWLFHQETGIFCNSHLYIGHGRPRSAVYRGSAHQ